MKKSLLLLTILLVFSSVSAAPTRSSIATKEIAYIEKPSTITAKSYVQKGLLALWDSIENVAWGTQDYESPTWNDLTGNYSFTLNNTTSWGNNCLVLNGQKGITGTSAIPAVSIEIVYRHSAEVYNRSPFQANNTLLVMSSVSEGSLLLRFGNRNMFQTSVAFDPSDIIQVYADTSTRAIYLFGARQSVSSASWTITTSQTADIGFPYSSHHRFAGKIYAIRLYNRSLTAAEIAHNYKIDKARFNLP